MYSQDIPIPVACPAFLDGVLAFADIVSRNGVFG